MHLPGGSSELQLRRVGNLMMPVCRVIGCLLMLTMIYHLLIELGLPSTLLAFSAVPGLAIGLGASKLLGNLFGGLSIQTDRRLRVGEFRRIDDHLGFVTKIGLRSLELETMGSRVTIPNAIANANAIANEENIVNHSHRSNNSNNPHPVPRRAPQYRLNQALSRPAHLPMMRKLANQPASISKNCMIRSFFGNTLHILPGRAQT